MSDVKKRQLLRLVPLGTLLVSGLLFATTAGALTVHGNFSGTDVDFLGVQETSSFGDPEPLFGAPTVLGNQLLFFPTTFTANAAGAGDFDQTGSQLQTTIMATGSSFLDTITITEFGDTVLTGIGTGATGTFVSMSGFVTIQETSAGTCVVVPFVEDCQVGFVGTFTPTDLLGLPGDAGTTLWSGSVVVDLAAEYAEVTKAVLSFDNDLTAFSEDGTTAKIQKKVVDGPSIIIEVPEASMLTLLGTSLLALFARSRGLSRRVL